ncbi:MAG TPA: exosortase/archaeosortase family protein [Terracidiphilus sp.]
MASSVNTKITHAESGLFAFWAAALVVGWRSLAETFTLSARNDEYTHILLILPISAFLIYRDWRSLRALIARNVPAGTVLLLIAALTAFFARARSASLSADVALSLTMLAFVLWSIGAFLLWLGTRATRAALFPLCFLFGLIPPPQRVLDEIIFLLQLGSAWAAHVLFSAFGVPVDQTGVFLTIPGLTVQVAQECSSIRSSSMLLVTTIVLAQLLLHSPWRKLLVIGLAVPLSIAKNGLRIWVIAMLGTRVDPGYLTGRLHHQGGIVFFAIALISISVLLWLLRRGENLVARPV